MKSRLLELACEANPSSREFYDSDWKYNCAAWTGEELEKYAESIVEEIVSLLIAESLADEAARKRTSAQRLMQIAEEVSNYFKEESQ